MRLRSLTEDRIPHAAPPLSLRGNIRPLRKEKER